MLVEEHARNGPVMFVTPKRSVLLRKLTQLGSLSNHDGDCNENGKKQWALIGKTTTLHVHHAFLFISYPSLHDYKVKVLHFTFCRGREHKTTTLEFNSKNVASI